MVIVLRDYDSKTENNLKFICAYSNEATEGQIVKCSEAFETTIKNVGALFAHDINSSYYSVQKHYTLTQLCKIFL